LKYIYIYIYIYEDTMVCLWKRATKMVKNVHEDDHYLKLAFAIAI